MKALTGTQHAVLEALSDERFLSPTEVAKTATDGNAGGAAASLRILVERGLVEKKQIGKKGNWRLYGYRLRKAHERPTEG